MGPGGLDPVEVFESLPKVNYRFLVSIVAFDVWTSVLAEVSYEFGSVLPLVCPSQSKISELAHQFKKIFLHKVS